MQKFEKTARNMHSLSRYSRQNAINKEWIDEYLNEAHSQGLQSVRAHFNVMEWGKDMEELKHLCNDVGSQLASMEVRNTAIMFCIERFSFGFLFKSYVYFM